MKRCPVPWSSLSVQPNGIVNLCCFSTDFEIGNVHFQSLEEIWNCERIKRVRKQMIDGEEPEECFLCYRNKGSLSYWRYKEINKNDKIKNENFSKTMKNYENKKIELDSFPIHMSVGFNNRCNISCLKCYVIHSKNREKDWFYLHMKSETFNKMTPFFRYCYFIDATSHGEALLNPNFFEYINEIAKYNCGFGFNTNGLSLTKSVIDKFVNLTVPKIEIIFSIDSFRSKVYNYLHKGSKLNSVKENLKELNRNRQNKIVKKLFFCIMNKNRMDIPFLPIWSKIYNFEVIHLEKLMLPFFDEQGKSYLQFYNKYNLKKTFFARLRIFIAVKLSLLLGIRITSTF